MTVYFLIPVYNEKLNIVNLHGELKQILPGENKFFVFSDDGSTDGSRDLLQQQFHDLPHIVLGDGINRGPGHAFNAGFEWILSQSQDTEDKVVTMEADCTSDIGILPEMLSISRLRYDLVLASVYVQGGGFEKTTFLRKLISSFANLLYRFLFDIKVQTLSSFYRVYSLGLLKKIKAQHGRIISEPGFICMLEVLIKAVDNRARIIEVPMVLASSKRQGQSKMKIIKTSLQYFRFLISTRRKKH